MKRTGIFATLILTTAAMIFPGIPPCKAEVPVPDFLARQGVTAATDPLELADAHLKAPYRQDGVLDEEGRYTTFNRPDRFFDSPGYNCSGLVVSLARYLFDRNFTLEEVRRDRLGDSGPDAPMGEDWDFGWDLILNLTEKNPRKVLMPDGSSPSIDEGTGESLRGFSLHDSGQWKKVLEQMRPGNAYLVSISKPSNRRGYRLLHYHVALILPDEAGEVWLYHTTRRSRTHRIDLADAGGLRRFMSQFQATRGGAKEILVVEATLPSRTMTASASQPATTAPSSEPAEATGEPSKEEKSSSFAPASPVEPKSPASSPPPLAEEEAEKPSGVSNEETGPKSESAVVAAGVENDSDAPPQVIRHVSGRVLHAVPELVTHIPRFDEARNGVELWYRNRGDQPRALEIVLKTPDQSELEYESVLPPRGADLTVSYPEDFSGEAKGAPEAGRYEVEARVEGKPWSRNVFEIAALREARPKIVKVDLPSSVRKGRTFRVRVTAENQGAESDYGGITVSSPDPSALRIVSADPGKVFGTGSTVLSVTSDKIATRVPMAERWINLWGENKKYDMTLRVRALKEGVHPLYVRCAVRGVNVRSNVILMDPASSETADQQGFPVYIHEIEVQ